MKAEILTIGDEILIGQITNTNSVWIAQQLNLIGVQIVHMCSVPDQEAAIVHAFEEAAMRADFVFITGGLGPTKDDITKKTFSKYFEAPLILNQEVLNQVASFFTKRGRELTEVNRQQAFVPEGATVIMNQQGTAPGMWMKKNNTVYISMPGVPYEMKAMMTAAVLPKIKSEYNLPFIFHKTVLTNGIGESLLAEKISAWEDSLAVEDVKLAYLPQPGMVRLRLSGYGDSLEKLQTKINTKIHELESLVPEYIFGYENYGEETPSLEKIVSEMLRGRKKTLSIAESCTGGHLTAMFTAIPGASDIIKGGIVPYTNEAKHKLLLVDETIFTTVGAVSKECVLQLAEHAIKKFKSDYSISISGIAGPSGGTDDKPVGTVWIAVASTEKSMAMKFQFGDNRSVNIVMSCMAALNLFRKFLLKKS